MSAKTTYKSTAVHALAVVTGFAAFYLAFFSPVLARGVPFGIYDGWALFLPIFLAGPDLWNTSLFSGFPLIADIQWNPFYAVKYLFPNTAAGWNLYVVSAYVMASAFCYGFAHALTKSRLAASAAGLCYGLSGFMICHLDHTGKIHQVAWVPLALWAIEKNRERVRPAWIAAGAAAVALCIVGGHPQAFFFAIALIGFYAAAAGVTAPAGRWRSWTTSAVLLATGIGLTAVQLLPTAELAEQSTRAAMSFAKHNTYSFHRMPFQLIATVFPNLFGGAERSFYGVPYFGAYNLYELGVAYVGLLPLMLAAAAMIGRARDWRTWFWAAVCAVSAVLALGDATPAGRLMFQVPGYNNFRSLARNYQQVCLGAAMLAAFGVGAIARGELSRRAVMRIGIGGAAVFAVCLAAVSVKAGALRALAKAAGIEDLTFAPWHNPAVGVPLIVFVLSAAGLLFFAGKPASAFRKTALTAVLIVDLGSFAWFHAWRYHTQPAGLLDPPAHAEKYKGLLAKTHQRVLAVEGSLNDKEGFPPNLSMAWDVPSASGNGQLLLARYARLWDMSVWGSARSPFALAYDRTADLCAVRYAFRTELSEEDGVEPVAGPQGRFWPAKDMKLELNYGSRLPGPRPLSHTFHPETTPGAAAIAVVSSLGRSTGLRDGEPVAAITIRGASGQTRTVTMNAGEHTSEWAIDCTHAKGRTRHRRAPVFDALPTPRKNDPDCTRNRYLAVLPFEPVDAVEEVRIDWIGRGGKTVVTIDKAALIDESRETFDPLDALADTTRWRRVATIGRTGVFENRTALPRAWMVNRTVRLEEKEALGAIRSSLLPDGSTFDPAATALVEEDVPGAPFTATTMDARVVADEGSRLAVKTVADGPAFLVVSDPYYEGWRAAIDEEPAAIHRTDYVLRGVAVPKGEHVVEFVYRPKSFVRGAAVSGVSLVVLLAIAIAAVPRRRETG